MKKIMLFKLFVVSAITISASVQAAEYRIGDNDGYGLGIADGGSHRFDLNDFKDNYYDGRDNLEKKASDGSQFTDTYSTTGQYSPQGGDVATFTFSNLGKGWKSASLEIDMLGFEQGSTYTPVSTSFNGIQQIWGFEDGIEKSVIRNFSLSQILIDSINANGELVITVDRDGSKDFYSFDYLKLTGESGGSTVATPIPAAFWLFGSAFVSLTRVARRRASV